MDTSHKTPSYAPTSRCTSLSKGFIKPEKMDSKMTFMTASEAGGTQNTL